MFSIVFSLIIPIISFHLKFQSGFVKDFLSNYSISNQNFSTFINKTDSIDSFKINTADNFGSLQVLTILYIIGFSLFIVRFIKNLNKISKQIKSSSIIQLDGFKLILTDDQISIHCFYNSIFVNKLDYPDNIDHDLLMHELEHLRQGHTLDIILVELFQIIFWFNPISILYKNAIKTNHEYLADDGVIKSDVSIREYSEKLINFIAYNNNPRLVSGFKHSLTKKRLIMLTKNHNSLQAKLKILTLIPVISFLMMGFSSSRTTPQQGKFHKIFQEREDSVYVKADQMPLFLGQSIESFDKWTASEIKYPAEAINQKIIGCVTVAFIVEKDGSISNVKVLRSVPTLDEEAVRVVKSSPKWTPGLNKNVEVRVYCTVPVLFMKHFDRIDATKIKLKKINSNKQ
ncbi:MAG TPA: M56 family metallopeptidase [Ignavibacteria bacterium]